MRNLLLLLPAQSASWVKKVDRAESCNFPTDSCEFPTEELRVAQNFNSAPKFPQNGGFQPQILHVWMKLFWQENQTIYQQPTEQQL